MLQSLKPGCKEHLKTLDPRPGWIPRPALNQRLCLADSRSSWKGQPNCRYPLWVPALLLLFWTYPSGPGNAGAEVWQSSPARVKDRGGNSRRNTVTFPSTALIPGWAPGMQPRQGAGLELCGSPALLRLRVIEMQSTYGQERIVGGEKKRDKSLIKVPVRHLTLSRRFAKHQTYPSERNNSL